MTIEGEPSNLEAEMVSGLRAEQRMKLSRLMHRLCLLQRELLNFVQNYEYFI
jgi:hypothetical protein